MSDLHNNPAALSQVLAMLSESNTETIKQGEKLLKPFLKNPQCLADLFHQVQSSPDARIRHHAALLMKKKSNLYKKVPGVAQGELRIALARILVGEQDKGVAIAIGGLISKIFRVVIDSKESYPEVFDVITQLSGSQEPKQRIICYEFISQLGEHAADSLISHTEAFCQLLVKGFEDSVSEVSVSAFQAASLLIAQFSHSEAVMTFRSVLTPVLNVLANALSRGEEEVVVDGLSLFQECASMEFPLINDHLEILLPFLVNIMKGENIDGGIKQSATHTFTSLVESRPKLIGKKGLVAPCLRELVGVIASAKNSSGSMFVLAGDGIHGDGDDDDSYDPDSDEQRLAQICIDGMALHIPSKYFVQPALQLCEECIVSPDPAIRKAGCAVLGIIAEGCADSIRPMLNGIVPPLLQSCQDVDVKVKECACFALGQFSEHCQPEILHFHQVVLPAIASNMDCQEQNVLITSCYVMEMFSENLQPESLRPHLNNILNKLVNLLNNNKNTVKETALSALAAISVAAEKDFIPYTQQTVGMLSNFLFVSDPALFAVRGRALECLGHIAIAIGNVEFQPFFTIGIQSAMQATNMPDESLKEYSYIFIANCAKAMTRAFDPLLPTLVPHLLEIIAQSELEPVDGEQEDLDGDEDDEDGANDYHINVQEGFVNNKKGALTALGALAQYTLEAFFPYLESSINVVLTSESAAITSFHTSIRAEAYSILREFVRVAKAAAGLSNVSIPKEQIIDIQDPVLIKVLKFVMGYYINAVLTDVERQVVSNVIEGLHTVITELGMAAIIARDDANQVFGEKIMTIVHALLTENAACQGKLEEEEEDDDHDNGITDAVSDLIGGLAKVMGGQFVQYFDGFSKILAKFMKDNRSHTDRSMAIGCFAEVLLELGPVASRYLDLVLPAIHSGLGDAMEGVRRNSAFCVAAIVDSVGSELSQAHVLQLLQWLYPLCVRDAAKLGTDCGGADIDNALSAVARMINRVPSALPLNQVLPVMLNSLPIQSDPLEGATIYGCLVRLVEQKEANALSMLPQILQVFAKVLGPNSKDNNEGKNIVIQAIRNWSSTAEFHNALPQIQDPSLLVVLQQACA